MEETTRDKGEEAPNVGPCGMFVVETTPEGATRLCGEPATTTRKIGRLTFAVCERCAADIDAFAGGAS